MASPAHIGLLLFYELLCEPKNALFVVLLFMASHLLPSQSSVEAANCTILATSEFRSAVYDGLGIIFALYNLLWDTVCHCIVFILSLHLELLARLLAF